MKTPTLLTEHTITIEALTSAADALSVAVNRIRLTSFDAIDGVISTAKAAREYNASIKDLFDFLSSL